MSGGSFNYLYTTDMLAHEHDLRDMRDALADAGAKDAADATDAILKAAEVPDPLRDLWHAMEWWRSADYAENQFREALDEYRAHTATERMARR